MELLVLKDASRDPMTMLILDRPHLDAFVGGYYHRVMLSIALEIMAEELTAKL